MILQILKKLKNNFSNKIKKLKIIPKFGIQFLFQTRKKFLEKIKHDFWLDLKINDIPQTAISAIDSLKDLKNVSISRYMLRVLKC